MIKAVILAGGLGTRLRSAVADRPKPLAPIAGEPFLARQLRHLRGFGVERFVLCVGYQAQMMIDVLGDGVAFDATIEYAVEDEPLGTAGAVKNAGALLAGEQDFLLLNGDTFVEVAVDALVARHRASAALGTICVQQVADAGGKGVVELDPSSGLVTAFDEKALEGQPALINAGVYVFARALVDRIPSGRSVSLERETIPGLLAAGQRLAVMVSSGRMIDIGTPEDYQRAQRELATWAGAAKVKP